MANGNVVSDVDPLTSLARQFIFNGDNKQTEVKKDGITIGRYFYDGEGKRVKKVTDAETTVFVYSAGKLIAEYSTQPSQSPSIAYTTTDHLGTPRVITDQFGQVKARRDFMPFGEEITPDGTHRTTNLKYNFGDNVRQKFTGYQKDEETQLDFAEARMYQNLHARFTAVDPLLASGKSANPQTFNRYVYVMNNPLIFTDPTGLQAATSPGQWGYRDYEENGQQMRSFRFFRSKTDRETAEAMQGPYTNWTGNNFYIFDGSTKQAISLPENGNGMIFSTEKVSVDKMTDIVQTQQRGDPFNDDQIATLKRAQTDVVMKTPEMEFKKGLSGLAGGLLAGGVTAGTNSFLRNVAFGTQRSGAVFFSGPGTFTPATQFATSSGRQTIEMTAGGRALNFTTNFNVGGYSIRNNFTYVNNRLWGWGSRHFAHGASGNVTVFLGTPLRPNSIWSTIERPILEQNRNVILNFRPVPSTTFP